MPTIHRSIYLLALLALLSAPLSIWWSDQGLVRHKLALNGLPVEIFRPADGRPAPAIVIVHGFAGSRQIMYSFGYTLARNGYVAALIDLPGHGQSRIPFPRLTTPAPDATALLPPITTAITYLRDQPYVQANQIALLGHSMGAGAVVRYGIEHAAEVAAVVAIAGTDRNVTTSVPRNVLWLVGAQELAPIRANILQTWTAATGTLETNGVYGDVTQGTARRLLTVPGADHLTVLWNEITLRETLAWYDTTFDHPPRAGVWMDRRMWAVLPALLGGIILFFPLSRAVGQRTPRWNQPDRLRAGPLVLTLMMPPIVSPLLTWILPTGWFPQAVTGDIAIFFFVYGLTTIIGMALGNYWRQFRARLGWRWMLTLALAACTFGYWLLTFAWISHATWANLWLDPPRLILFAVLFLLFLPFFLTHELLIRGRSAWKSTALWWISKGLLVGSLLASVLYLGGPFFLLLILPVFLIFWFVFSLYSGQLYRLTGNPLPGGLFQAGVLAWMSAAIFPIHFTL